MTYRDQLRWLAFDHHGIVTTEQARAIGVPAVALRKLATRNAMRHLGHGVYSMEEAPTTRYTEYAKALALAGPDAMLADESVLAFHDLALVNPRSTKVMTKRRVRAQLPSTVEVLRRTELPAPVFFEGLASMPLADALLACRGRVQTERLLDATHEARVRGLIRPAEADAVAKALAVV